MLSFWNTVRLLALKQVPKGTTMPPKICRHWNIDCKRKNVKEDCERSIVKERLWKKNCERMVVKERLWKNDCEREIVKERLWIRDCEREIVKERL